MAKAKTAPSIVVTSVMRETSVPKIIALTIDLESELHEDFRRFADAKHHTPEEAACELIIESSTAAGALLGRLWKQFSSVARADGAIGLTKVCWGGAAARGEADCELA
ncbi:hypothetical protein [Acidisoma silvae]|uniref:Uncharacterized protein n=1 Tax=Acidisoma silvae TaxID=2802396 RepID=A0A964E1Q6_9PROT|nr:hypothetical protein [Acidisoma silvae]MCB8878489.1 hypothetical protein [Acidisoma silvae]